MLITTHAHIGKVSARNTQWTSLFERGTSLVPLSLELSFTQNVSSTTYAAVQHFNLKNLKLCLYKCFSSTDFNFIMHISLEKIVPKKSQRLYNTRSRLNVIPTKANNCREERSLLTADVHLYNKYLVGEQTLAPLGPQGRGGGRAGALWGRVQSFPDEVKYILC